MGWLFQPLAPAAAQLLSGGPATYNETGAAAFGMVASGADSYTPGSSGFTYTILDAFGRADGVLGSAWTNPIDPSSVEFRIVSGAITAEAIAYADGYWNAGTEPDGTGVAVRIPTLSTGGVWLCTRVASPGGAGVDYYLLFIDSDGSGNIQRVNNVSYSTIQTFSAGTFSSGDYAGFIASGTGATVTLTGYQSDDGVTWNSVVSYDDTSGSRLTAVGYNGLGTYGTASRLDDFGTLVASGAATYNETGAGVLGWSGAAVDTSAGVDGGAVVAGALAAGGDVQTSSDVGAGVFGWVASGQGAGVVAEAGAIVGAWSGSGGDGFAMADGGAVVAGAVAAGASVAAFVDAGAGVVGWVGSGADAGAVADAGGCVVGSVASGADSYTPGGGDVYSESGAVVAGAVASGADVVTMADGGATAGAWAVSGDGVAIWVDGGSAGAPWASSGQDATTAADAGGGVFGALAAGGDVAVAAEPGAAVYGWVATGAEMVVTTGTAPYPFEVRGGSRAVADDGTRARDGSRRVAGDAFSARGGGRRVAP